MTNNTNSTQNKSNLTVPCIGLSLLAILLLGGMLIYEYVTEHKVQTTIVVILLANITIMCANISNYQASKSNTSESESK